MVYSAELGYDPEEWEECPPPDHFLAFGWFTRIVLALAAVLFAFVFFYVLERRKTWAREERRASYASIQPLAERRDQLDDEEDEQAEEKIADAIRKAAIAAATNGTRTSRSRSRTTTPMRKRLSQAELVSLEKWEEEVKAMERRRLVASESPPPSQPAARAAEANDRPAGEPFSSHAVGGSLSKSSDEPTVVPVADEQPAGRKAGTAGVAEVFDSPARTAPTPPSTPPGPPSESQSAALNEHYERLASELERKLWAAIQNEADASATPPADLQARLHRRHESEIKAAAAQLQKHATPEAQTAAEEFRRRFEDQIDSMVEEYNRMHGRSEAGAHSSNESDVEQFERVGDSPALFYPSESDDPEAEATSFTYEASPKDGRSPAVPRHALGTIFSAEGGNSPIPRVLINDKHAKKSSSSSEEGFVKIYSDLVEHIKEEEPQPQPAAPRVEAEEQMREILQEYESVPAAAEQPSTPLAQPREETKRPIAQITVQSPPEVPQLPLSPPLQLPPPTVQTAEIPTPPAERRSVSPQPQLVPLGGYLGNFLQQYQQAPDGSLYPQGPDGMFYKQNKDGQLVPISSELQDLLQQQQQSGLQQPLIKTTNGNIYQQGPNGQFFEQMSDGQMYRVPPAVQKLIQQEIQEALQLGERRSTEPQDFIRGPDGVLYEKGPLGQFYEPGPDGKLHRVTPDVQRQLLDLVEEQKKWEKEATAGEGRSGVKFEDQQQSASPSPLERQFDPAVIQTPDGKIFEMASDGSFYQLGRDGRLYRIPYELQTQLLKRHKAMTAEKKARDEQKRAVGGTSTESEPPPFDPEYPYHPKRKVPMQPHPDSKTPPAVGSPAPDSAYDAEQPEFSPSELHAWRQNPEQIPPEFRDLVQAALKADEVQRQQLQPDPNEAARVRELLHEYDLSTSTDAPREQRETRPSPNAEQIQQQLKILDPNAAASSGPASPSDFDLLQAPGEELAVLRSQPQSPSVSSGAAAQQAAAPRVELQTSASPPYFDHHAQKYRESSEQLGARDHRKQLAREEAEDAADEAADDPRRRAAAEIFLQDAIDYVDNQNRTASSGFVVEEDMLASEKLPAQMQNASAEPTSRLIRTNDVFEKPEPGFDDGDDAVTYAPEIQSEEVPPDQVSQASSNMIDQLPDEMLYPDLPTPLQVERPSAPLPISASSPQLLPRDSPERNEQAEERPEELPQRHQQHRISVQHPQLLFDPLQEPPVQPQIPSSEQPRRVDADDDDHKARNQSTTTANKHANNQTNNNSHPPPPPPPTTIAAQKENTCISRNVTGSRFHRRNSRRFLSTQRSVQRPLRRAEALEASEATSNGNESKPTGAQTACVIVRPRPRLSHSLGRCCCISQRPPMSPILQARNSEHPKLPSSSPSANGDRRRATSTARRFPLDPRALLPARFKSKAGVTSMQEMLLTLTSVEELSAAMRKAGLETTNLIFGVDYTASNKYQGEHSFDGRSLHFVEDPAVENPYQQVIKIMGRSLAPFINEAVGIPVYGFGDNESGDWGVFPLNGTDGICRDLSDVLKVYNEVTPTIALGGPTNFAPLIFQAIQLCQRNQEYHILIITCDGQVTNERATRKAIVQACQFPLSIIVVGVGDGPWEMMRVFDESLPKRPWDNFHFVTFSDISRSPQDPAGELAFAIQTLLEVPDQYHHIVRMGLVPNKQPSSTR
ncbi:CRE-CPNA-1 protein [Aphelenchoides fujianensis]|nr:CRE-CPNA-1 protein [Aphelenchoides fujianensis]